MAVVRMDAYLDYFEDGKRNITNFDVINASCNIEKLALISSFGVHLALTHRDFM
jgi:hypothetical protein